MSTPTEPDRRDALWQAFFGAPLWEDSYDRWLAWLEDALRHSAPRPPLVVYQNLHTLYLLHRHRAMAACYQQAELCYLDGYGPWLLCRLLGRRISSRARFTFMDCFPDLLRHAEERGWRVFYLGSSPESLEEGLSALQQRFPTLSLDGRHGYVTQDAAVVAAINAFAPDLLFVGMGSPQQENWLLRHGGELRAGVILTAGGTMDYFSGAQAKPPLFLSRMGLAWSYRLLGQPRRLAFRYLVEPLLLLPTVARHAVRLIFAAK